MTYAYTKSKGEGTERDIYKERKIEPEREIMILYFIYKEKPPAGTSAIISFATWLKTVELEHMVFLFDCF
jgi:hypothetical protein